MKLHKISIYYAFHVRQIGHLVRKPTICICKNKGADQLRGSREADHAFVFATRIVQSLYFLNTKFHASSSFLRLYRPVCVEPVRKPHCWFSHKTAQILNQVLLHTAYLIQFRSSEKVNKQGLVNDNLHQFSINRFSCPLPLWWCWSC